MTERIPTPNSPASGLPKSRSNPPNTAFEAGQVLSAESIQDLSDNYQPDHVRPEPSSRTAQTHTDGQTSAAQSSRSFKSFLKSLLTTFFRLTLLGLGGSLAWSVGVLVAHFNPGQPQAEIPLQESVLRRTNRTLTKLRQLPQWWQQDGVVSAPAAPILLPNLGVTAVPANPTSSDLSQAELSQEQREVLQTDVEGLQSELSALNDRVSLIESDLGQSNGGRSLERRIEVIEQLITTESAVSSDAQNSSATDATTRDSAIAANTLPTAPRLPQVTLPSDVLFERNSSQLKVDAESILDAIVVDLLSYPDATILIASYTDDAGDAADNRELSFLRASAIERYFEEVLGDQYRWVPVGYGESRPLADNVSDLNRQRNRRIELTIDQR